MIEREEGTQAQRGQDACTLPSAFPTSVLVRITKRHVFSCFLLLPLAEGLTETRKPVAAWSSSPLRSALRGASGPCGSLGSGVWKRALRVPTLSVWGGAGVRLSSPHAVKSTAPVWAVLLGCIFKRGHCLLCSSFISLLRSKAPHCPVSLAPQQDVRAVADAAHGLG